MIAALARQAAASTHALGGAVRIGRTGDTGQPACGRVIVQRATGAALVITGGAGEVALGAIAAGLRRAHRNRASQARCAARLDVHCRWTEITAGMQARAAGARACRRRVDAGAVTQLLAIHAGAATGLPVASGNAVEGIVAGRARNAAGLRIRIGDAAAGTGVLARRTRRHARIAAGVSTVGAPVTVRIGKLRRSVLPLVAAVGPLADQGLPRRGARAGQKDHQRSRQ
jgi:hypothetical protein